MNVLRHAQTEPFLVGSDDDSPADAAARMGWVISQPPKRKGSVARGSVVAVGKSGPYRIRRESVGCRAYPVGTP